MDALPQNFSYNPPEQAREVLASPQLAELHETTASSWMQPSEMTCETEAKSPLLSFIHRVTDHPGESSYQGAATMSNTTESSSSAGTSKSPLLHAIHLLTNDPALHELVSEQDSTKGRLRSVAQGAAACGVGFTGAAIVLAVTKIIAEKSPQLQSSFQRKWSRLETSIAGMLGKTSMHSAQAQQAVRAYIDENQEQLKASAQRAFRILLLGTSLLAVKSRPGMVVTPAKVLLSPTCLVASAAATALLSHKPAVGVPDHYKRARTAITSASGAVRERIETVAKSNKSYKAVYAVLGIRALTQRKNVQGSSRAKMLIPAALAAGCTEFCMRSGTENEPEAMRLKREACMQYMRTHGSTLQADIAAKWKQVGKALRDLVAAAREYCNEQPGKKRGVQAALVIAMVLSAAALKRSGRSIPGSAVTSEALGASASSLQAAAASAAAAAKNLVGEYEVPDWMQSSLGRLQLLAGQGIDAAVAVSSSVVHRVAPAIQDASKSASAAASELGEQVTTGAGSVKSKAAEMSQSLAEHASTAGGALAASTVAAAKSAPAVLAHVAQNLPEIAKSAPDAVSGVWNSLLAALEQYSKLADENEKVKAAEHAIKEAAENAIAAHPKGLDKLAHAVLRPELLIYGAIAAEMHMRGALPRMQAVRGSSQGIPPPGITVSGRVVKTGLVNALRGTQTCVRAISEAVNRARSLPSAFSCTGVPRSIGEQSLSSAAVGSRSKSTQATLETPAGTDSPVAPLSTASVAAASQTDTPIQDRSLKFANLQQAWANLAALQELEHVRVTHTGDGAKYVGGNPTWMVNGLAEAGLLKDEELKAAAVAVSSRMRASIEDTIKNTCMPSEASLETAQELFMLEAGFSHLNHGSYGATLKASQAAANVWRSALESGPSQYMEEVAVPALAAAVSSAAELIGGSTGDCVPVTNATTGITTVLAALNLAPGDAIITLSSAYSAVKTAIGQCAAAAGASVVEIDLDMECVIDQRKLVNRVTDVLEKGQGNIKAAVFDHIVSFPPVVLPLTELIAACRTASCKVIIDGAHAVGNFPDLSCDTLHPDAYITNLHKWLCTPKGTAMLWVSPSFQDQVKPLVMSHAEGLGFAAEHLWTGTADLSPWLAVPAAVEVHKRLGLAAAHKHRSSMLEEGVAVLVKTLRLTSKSENRVLVVGGTGTPPGAPSSPVLDLAGFPSMAAVRLPALPNYDVTPAAAQVLRNTLRHQHRVEVPIIAWDGSLWVRVSSALYNTAADFERLAEAIQTIQTIQQPTDRSTAAGTKFSDKQAPSVARSAQSVKSPTPTGDLPGSQSLDSEVSANVPEVNKSLKDFYGCNPMAEFQIPHDLSNSKMALRASSGHLTDHLVGFGVEDDSELESPAEDSKAQPAGKEDSAMEPAKAPSLPSKGIVQLEESSSLTGEVQKPIGGLKDLNSHGLDDDPSELSSPRTFSAIERCGRVSAEQETTKAT